MKILVINTEAGADLLLYDTHGSKKYLERAMKSKSFKQVANIAIKYSEREDVDVVVADSKAMNNVFKEEYKKYKFNKRNQISKLTSFMVSQFPNMKEEDPIEAAIEAMTDMKNQKPHTVVLNIENLSSDDIIKLTEKVSGSLVTSEK